MIEQSIISGGSGSLTFANPTGLTGNNAYYIYLTGVTQRPLGVIYVYSTESFIYLEDSQGTVIFNRISGYNSTLNSTATVSYDSSAMTYKIETSSQNMVWGAESNFILIYG